MPSHSETRALPYTAQQMYDLVADVAKYPDFIPWTIATRVLSVEEVGDHKVMHADMVVGFKMFRERFQSRVTLWEDAKKIDTEYVDGPFKYLVSNWEFEDTPTGSNVHFKVDFEFKNRLLQGAAGLFFMDAMQRIVRAFEARAAALYGPGA
ncbi:type II toxin-antitoxin system RatA family toxin [Gymnodinialimonas ceratoperidinii]|uniref:Type II toxin-antitoxin system RatA family toxin n=1 Tax=Gymnodinialimonas ceratoperidinii TaxID=2856823 RepID=A0A8F6TTQ9_9RHOB|nr:type II toxin-antitoxin system RatA family toxin [Gymnodinialimonas ceratoperidinii]QXT38323.1 type II toxin-antitoxin system RatA family toxin [Gymnodinialimonas ceratoperidinii]